MPDTSEFADRVADALGTVPLPPGDLGLGAALVAYRRSRSIHRVRHRVVRFVASLVAATGVVAGGGVAAAYAASLPLPAQRFAHHLLAPLGVPAPRPRHHRPLTQERGTGPTVLRPRCLPAPTGSCPVLTVHRRRVRVGSAELLTATAPPGAIVRLVTQRPGGWRTVSSAHVPTGGRVEFRARPRVDTVYAAEIVGPAVMRSAPVGVTVEPVLVARVHERGNRWYVDVRSVGTSAGDLVRILVLGIRPIVVTAGRVDRTGAATLVVVGPSPGLHYRVDLAPTASHDPATVELRAPH